MTTSSYGPGLPVQKSTPLPAVVAVVSSSRYISTSKSSGSIAITNTTTFGGDSGIEANFFSNLSRSDHKVQVERKSMNWSTYFALRGTRRLYERVFMVPSTLGGLFGGGYWFAQQAFDPTMSIFGMDQVLVYGLGTLGSGLLGLALGPVVGNMIFWAVHANARPLVDKMDREFFQRIVLNRANPTGNPLAHHIPDFYGEKIKSVSDYRSWLRKQREYRRKIMYFL
ncbi:TIM23 complex component [Mortierella sp. 14UC]|nr:TIM23 complex component [Mortierella sp. 14UC]